MKAHPMECSDSKIVACSGCENSYEIDVAYTKTEKKLSQLIRVHKYKCVENPLIELSKVGGVLTAPVVSCKLENYGIKEKK